jgi:hypothetical protein
MGQGLTCVYALSGPIVKLTHWYVIVEIPAHHTVCKAELGLKY